MRADGHVSGKAALIVGVGLITLAGAVLRASFLDHPMRYDESYNYLNYASRSPAYIVTHYTPNNHVLHTLLVAASRRVFGDRPAALRLPAFAGGVLLIPATAWLAWVLSRRRFAVLLAAGAVAVASPMVEYSANARGYSWLALFTVLLAVTTIRLARDPSPVRWWVAWMIAAVLGAFTVPVMVLPLAGSVATLAWSFVANEPLRRLALSRLAAFALAVGALTALLYTPMMVCEGPTKLLATREMAYGILSSQITSFAEMLAAAGTLAVRHAPVTWMALLGIGLAVFVLTLHARREPAKVAPLLMIAVPVGLAALLQAPLPARAWLFAIPIIAVCSAEGIGRAAAMARGRGCAAGVSLLAGALSVVAAMNVARAERLCSEPGGLVEVETALRHCRDFGAERCAVLSRYSPATAYYLRFLDMPALALADSPDTARVYIVADAAGGPEALWNPQVPGFSSFGMPRLLQTVGRTHLYIADRLETAAVAP